MTSGTDVILRCQPKDLEILHFVQNDKKYNMSKSRKIKLLTASLYSLFFITAIALAAELDNPLCQGLAADQCTLPAIIGRIVKGLMGILGSIALVMFLYGGYLWLTAAGNETKIKEGKETIVWATLGLVLIFASYSIVNFVFSVLVNK